MDSSVLLPTMKSDLNILRNKTLTSTHNHLIVIPVPSCKNKAIFNVCNLYFDPNIDLNNYNNCLRVCCKKS